jgi:hypothetical protein
MFALDGKWSELEVLSLVFAIVMWSTAFLVGIYCRFARTLREVDTK